MQRAVQLCLAAALICACGGGLSAFPETTEISGTVQWYSIEGGFWAIRGADGKTYDPSSPLDSRWQKSNLPIHAVVRVRSDLASFHMVGPIVDIIHIEQVSCEALPCPLPGPPVSLIVAASRGTPDGSVYQATFTNVQRPASAGVIPEFNCVTTSLTPTAPAMRICYIHGVVPGAYEADVTAPGYEPQHVRVEVAAHDIQPYECCAAAYVSQGLWVYLTPSK
jgi:hypothetical protein